MAEVGESDEVREKARLREELLTPIAKAWSTDMGVEVASLGVQVHGGMGFMNETLAAQLYRDARIAPIYEGTNGIQAIDLAGRKLSMADGAAMTAMIAEIDQTARQARETNDSNLVQIADRLVEANKALAEATTWMKETMKTDRDVALSGATAYLALAGDVIGGHFLTKGAVEARSEDGQTRGRMTALAGFFAETALAGAPGAVAGITHGGKAMLAESDALFGIG
ncbi:MAG: acyl-CoA dehydrogenase C-terminal domain-containing protein [Pseudomonadota bacterium]